MVEERIGNTRIQNELGYNKRMNEDDVIDMISEALFMYEDEYSNENPDESISIRTYEEVGMLTNNAGFVLRIGDHKFQVTVVKE